MEKVCSSTNHQNGHPVHQNGHPVHQNGQPASKMATQYSHNAKVAAPWAHHGGPPRVAVMDLLPFTTEHLWDGGPADVNVQHCHLHKEYHARKQVGNCLNV